MSHQWFQRGRSHEWKSFRITIHITENHHLLYAIYHYQFVIRTFLLVNNKCKIMESPLDGSLLHCCLWWTNWLRHDDIIQKRILTAFRPIVLKTVLRAWEMVVCLFLSLSIWNYSLYIETDSPCFHSLVCKKYFSGTEWNIISLEILTNIIPHSFGCRISSWCWLLVGLHYLEYCQDCAVFWNHS